MKRTEFEDLWTRYYNDVFYFIVELTPQKTDAEDLLQTVALKACRSYKRLIQPDSFKAWIMKIAKNTVFDYYRGLRKRRKITPMLDENELDAYLNSQRRLADGRQLDTLISVDSYVSGLPEKWRHALHLHLYYEMNYTEISRLMGMSYTVIYKRLVHLKRDLLKYMEGE